MTFKSGICFANLVVVLVSQWKFVYSIEYNLNSAKGNVTSPNYPNGYRNSDILVWKITVQPGQRIKLIIKDVNFGENCAANCDCDLVEVYNGYYNPSVNDQPIATFCTSVTNPPRIYTSIANVMEIVFVTEYRQKAGRGLWFYYEAIGSSTTVISVSHISTDAVVPETVTVTAPPTSSNRLSAVESMVLVVAVAVTVVLSVMVIFCCSIKKRCSRRNRRRSATPRPHPSPNQTLETTEEPTFEQMRNAPPSYEEAITNCPQNVYTPPPPYAEVNNNVQSANDTPSQSNVDNSTEEPYDSTGLPSYAEAHRLSQNSLDRV